MSDKIKLFSGNGHQDAELFTRYGDAVRAGQRKYGRKNFWVDTDPRVPSRSEQLLEQRGDGEAARRKRILDTL